MLTEKKIMLFSYWGTNRLKKQEKDKPARRKDSFEDFLDYARTVEGKELENRFFGDSSGSRPDEDELVIGKDRVSYLLPAPGKFLEDFRVSTDGEILVIKTDDSTRSIPLGVKISVSSVEKEYKNGVLIVKARRVD
jgi:HSP20 family molecular chaperone IbpA